MRRFQLPVAALLGLALAILPAVASSETSPTIEAVEELGTYELGTYTYTHHWSPPQASVAAGGTVTLSNPTTTPHGVEWVGGPAKPTCDSGVPVGTTPAASGSKWSGACTFAQAGTYTFYCTVHGPEMTGTVTVSADGTTTTTMSTPTSSTTTSTPAPGAASPPTEAQVGAPVVSVASLRAIQHGGSVKGSLKISKAGGGGRLQVDVFAQSTSLTRTKHSSPVRVGHLRHGSVSAGSASFVVALDAQARRALKLKRRLVLTVRITLTPSHGKPLTITRSVVEHP